MNVTGSLNKIVTRKDTILFITVSVGAHEHLSAVLILTKKSFLLSEDVELLEEYDFNCERLTRDS